MNTNNPADCGSAVPLLEDKTDPADPTPALPLPGEGAIPSLRNKPSSGTARSSPWQGGGREGVNCQPSSKNDSISPGPYSRSKTIFNPLGKKPLRQNLRKNLTHPERQLWQHLRNKQLGVKFRRQHGMGPYIADFYCPECALVIELDGESHFNNEAKQYDQRREAFMQTAGIKTLRFTNNEIAGNIEGVIQTICEEIHK